MDKNTLALWAAMATAPLVGKAETGKNSANFESNKHLIETAVLKTIENGDQTKKLNNFAGFLADEVKRVVAQDTVKKGAEGGGLDFEPSNLEDLETIAKKLKSITDSYKNLKITENITSDEGKKFISTTKEYLEKLIDVQKDLDDFFSRDIKNNPNNTNLATVLSNYLAEVVAPLQERIRWIKEAEKDLFSHKELVGIANNLSSTDKILISADAYDENNTDNSFEDIPNHFKETANSYKDLIDIKKDLKKIFSKLRKELSKDKKSQDLRKINKLQIEFFTKKNEFLAKKLELLNKSIPKDLAKSYNHYLAIMKGISNSFTDNIEKYQKEREKIMKTIVATGVKAEYLESELFNEPYNLQEAVEKNDLDEVINILNQYLKENRTILKYKTDDFVDSFKSEFEKGNIKTFDNIDDALNALKRSVRNPLRKSIEKYLKSRENLEKGKGESVNKKEDVSKKVSKDKEEISKDILEEINRFIVYMNAYVLKKNISKKEKFIAKNGEKNDLNKKLEAERLQEKHLQEAFNAVEVNFLKKMKTIKEEEGKHPEFYLKLAKAENELVVLKNRLIELKNELEKTREIYEKAGLKDGSIIKEKEGLVNKTKTEIIDKENEIMTLKNELKTSLNKVLEAWQDLEKHDGTAFSKIRAKASDLADKFDAIVVTLSNAQKAFDSAKELYDQALDLNNSEAVWRQDKRQEITKENLTQNKKTLLKIERKLFDLENMKTMLEKQRDEAKATMDEIDKFEVEINSKLGEIKALLKNLN